MMRAFVLLLCLLLLSHHPAFAGPSKPDVSIGISSDIFDKGTSVLDALYPQIKWETSGTLSGCDVSGGLSMAIKDIDDMPYGLWGKIKGSVAGIGLSAKGTTNSDNMSKWGLDLQASVTPSTTVQVTGVARSDQPSVKFANMGVTQKVDTSVGAFVISPRYNVASQSGDVKLIYGRGDTTVTLDADMDNQKVKVSQALGDNTVVAPSITSDGQVALEYSRSIGSGSLTAAYKPDSHVGLSYEDGPWVATLQTPLDGVYKVSTRPTFNIRRSIDITAF